MKELKRPLLSFFIFSYVLFFMFFTLIGIAMLFGAPESLIHILQIISSWSPTFAILILLKRIFPGIRMWDYIKGQFTSRVKASVLSTIVLLQVIIVAATVFLLSITNDTLALSFTSLGILVTSFLNTLVFGPMGEELGWRGYALNELQKKYSPLRSALILGVVWGFWHTPLWFASGFIGVDLIKYIVLFMIGIVSFSIILTLFYNLNKNLLIPILMHLLFNFSLVVIKGDLLDVLVYFMLGYFGVALLLIVLNPNGILYKR